MVRDTGSIRKGQVRAGYTDGGLLDPYAAIPSREIPFTMETGHVNDIRFWNSHNGELIIRIYAQGAD